MPSTGLKGTGGEESHSILLKMDHASVPRSTPAVRHPWVGPRGQQGKPESPSNAGKSRKPRKQWAGEPLTKGTPYLLAIPWWETIWSIHKAALVNDFSTICAQFTAVYI